MRTCEGKCTAAYMTEQIQDAAWLKVGEEASSEKLTPPKLGAMQLAND